MGNSALAASCRSEVTELDVSDEIRDFGELQVGKHSVSVATHAEIVRHAPTR